MANITNNKAANDIAAHFDQLVQGMHADMVEKQPHKQLIANLDLSSFKGLSHDAEAGLGGSQAIGGVAKDKSNGIV